MRFVTLARKALEEMQAKDAALHAQQQVFLPYLTGYVAFYAGDIKTALENLQKANPSDPFVQCLIGMAYEQSVEKDKATEFYRRASGATAHNPPAAFAVPFAKKKLGIV